MDDKVRELIDWTQNIENRPWEEDPGGDEQPFYADVDRYVDKVDELVRLLRRLDRKKKEKK